MYVPISLHRKIFSYFKITFLDDWSMQIGYIIPSQDGRRRGENVKKI